MSASISLCVGIPRHFYDRYDADRLLDSLGLTPEAIASTIVAAL